MKSEDVCFLARKLWQTYTMCWKAETLLCRQGSIIKAMVFPVVMYGCESWIVKKAECWRIDAFELWCWRRLLRVPWTARRSNQSVLREMNPEYLLEGLMLKLKLQYLVTWYEQPTQWKRPWCWERLRAEEKRVSEDEMARWHHQSNGHEPGQTSGDGEGQRGLVCCSPWCIHKELDLTGQLNNNNKRNISWPTFSSCPTMVFFSVENLPKVEITDKDIQ